MQHHSTSKSQKNSAPVTLRQVLAGPRHDERRMDPMRYVLDGERKVTIGRPLSALVEQVAGVVEQDPTRRMLQWVAGRWPQLTASCPAALRGARPHRLDRETRTLFAAVESSLVLAQVKAHEARLSALLAELTNGKLRQLRFVPGGETVGGPRG